eukprot:scaffold181608_cov63-Attheya_sp.AAC.1
MDYTVAEGTLSCRYNLLRHTTTSLRKPIPGTPPLYTKALLPPRSQVNKSDKTSQIARLKKKTPLRLPSSIHLLVSADQGMGRPGLPRNQDH